MSLPLGLAVSVSATILSKWTVSKDLVNYDSAICNPGNTKNRMIFLNLAQLPAFILSQSFEINGIVWAKERRIKLQNLYFYGDNWLICPPNLNLTKVSTVFLTNITGATTFLLNLLNLCVSLINLKLSVNAEIQSPQDLFNIFENISKFILKQLQCLVIDANQIRYSLVNVMHTISNNCHNLIHLELSTSNLDFEEFILPDGEIVHISTSEVAVINILKQNPQLQTIRLTFYCFSDLIIETIAGYCPEIQEIILEANGNSDHSLNYALLIKSCPKLNRLLAINGGNVIVVEYQKDNEAVYPSNTDTSEGS